jgi:glutathione S-transferase
MPRLHGVNASPFVRKTRVVLEEKGVAYELVPVMPIGVSDDFRRISPLGKIPCWEDGDYTLPDSSCICAYLERKHPEPPLYPAEPESLGRALWYEEYGDTRLVEVLTTVFFQRVVQARIMKQAPDEERVRQALTDLVPPVFDYLEGEVADADGIVDGCFGIADVALASPFVNFDHAGERVDPDRWPRLAAYVDRILSRPSFKALVEEEKAAFGTL